MHYNRHSASSVCLLNVRTGLRIKRRGVKCCGIGQDKQSWNAREENAKGVGGDFEASIYDLLLLFGLLNLPRIRFSSITGGSNNGNARLTRTASKSFSDTLTAALVKRKNRFKEISEELNQRINRDEKEEPYEKPLFNVEKIQRTIERVIEKQFVAVDAEEEPAKYVYDPDQNLNICQTISKQIKDRVKNMNYKR